MYYFAYGSNLVHEQMQARCPNSVFIGAATLADYKQVFDGWHKRHNGAVANVVLAQGESAVGGVYEVTSEDLRRLDIFEDVPNGTYHRIKLPVKMRADGSVVDVITYIRDPQPLGEPSKEYIAVIEAGKKDCGIL